jgi:Phosphotransferase enzyme family
MSRHDEVLSAARSRLGDLGVLADRSWDLGLAVVLEVRGADGATVILKGHSELLRFEIEVDAYRDVVPAIADRAPSLLWSDPEHRVIALSPLQGVVMPEPHPDPQVERALYRDAGHLLRRLHGALAPIELDAWPESQVEGLERWIARAPAGLLDPGDVDYARARIAELSALPQPVGVVCHSDWQPRNWLVGEEGISAFDFERVRREWWCHDFQRLWWREWWGRPDLAEAHFEGYGACPSAEEVEMLTATSAAGHLTQIVWGTEQGDLAFAAAGRRQLKLMRSP